VFSRHRNVFGGCHWTGRKITNKRINVSSASSSSSGNNGIKISYHINGSPAQQRSCRFCSPWQVFRPTRSSRRSCYHSSRWARCKIFQYIYIFLKLFFSQSLE
jgi:hypothetical protein